MNDKLLQKLHAAGKSITPQRLAVFEYLLSHDPASISGAITVLSDQADPASVYRAFALFKEIGIVEEIISGGRKIVELSGEFSHHHHHLTCLRCGRSVSLPGESDIESRLDSAARAASFTPVSHQIEISGLCHSCTQD